MQITKQSYLSKRLLLSALGLLMFALLCGAGIAKSLLANRVVGGPADQAHGQRKTDYGIAIEFGAVAAEKSQLEMSVTLEQLSLPHGKVKAIKASCSCVRSEVSDDGKAILLHYDGRDQSGRVSYKVMVISSDGVTKVIHLGGKVVPGWYSHPGRVVVANVLPKENKGFSCLVATARNDVHSQVQSCELSPPLDGVRLETERLRPSKIMIKGIVQGRSKPLLYTGHIDVQLSSKETATIKIPVEINFLGALMLDPPVVMIREGEVARVKIRSYDGRPLSVSKVDCDEDLKVRVWSDGTGLLWCELELHPQERRDASKVRVSTITVAFQDIDEMAEIQAVMLP